VVREREILMFKKKEKRKEKKETRKLAPPSFLSFKFF